jgi:Ala-tRNA(Pro) deacylase
VPANPDELFALLDQLGIEHSTVEHPPIFTVEEGRPWHDKIPGLHCKNLLIKDHKGGIRLVVMPAEKRADLARLGKVLAAPRLLRSTGATTGGAGIDARFGDTLRPVQRGSGELP